ncbi:MAG: tetraacyldisaccharide 4'-kinase [Cardiobacteriaceae bacterium]|nr:tetraacyldisaccharide 4'-kinase [Cardiobacteriaceae bacterium]
MDIPHWWRNKALLSYLFYPLSLLFRGGVFLRHHLYRLGWLRVYRAPVPVVVVGNLTVGGNGKTPLTLALAKALSAEGYQVGIISRGYGRATRHAQSALLVQDSSTADEVGDEPLLLYQQSALPVAVSKNRQAAIELLLTHLPVNLILADDGLQHKALWRDVELVAYASDLGFGNGFCLPAGALREPVSRLNTVDALILTDYGTAPQSPCPVFSCDKALCVYELSTENPVLWQDLNTRRCAVLTAIARPKRLLETLKEQGITPISLTALPDHSPISPHHLPPAEAVLITRKDAVKIKAWYEAETMVPVYVVDYQLQPPKALISLITQKIKDSP